MLLKNFYISTSIRVLLILFNCIAIAYVAVNYPDWLYLVNLLAILAIQVTLLIRSQNLINRELEKLFDTLQSSDTTTRFITKSTSKDFAAIFEKFDNVLNQIQALKVDSMMKSEYLSSLFEHINIGIISITPSGTIGLHNIAAKRIIGVGSLKHIDDINRVNSDLAQAILNIDANDSKLISTYLNQTLQPISIKSTKLKIGKEEIKLVSFQNIRNELDEREMEGWQKLIRVLTHELMNSAGPISSTITTIREILINSNGEPLPLSQLTPRDIADVAQGLKIIDERSKGMVDFVTRFRSLTLIPNPTFANHNIEDIVDSVLILQNDDAVKIGVQFIRKTVSDSVIVHADRNMVEQILINIFKNSFNALKEVPNPTVSISVWSDNSGSIYIDIADNGPGVSQNIADKIFVPFFTTRKDGTGIGLSLSRQLANIQGGALALTKSTGSETVFTLRLRGADDKLRAFKT